MCTGTSKAGKKICGSPYNLSASALLIIFVIFIGCAEGEVIELLKSSSIFHGATTLSDQLITRKTALDKTDRPLRLLADISGGLTTKRVLNLIGAALAILAAGCFGVYLPYIIQRYNHRVFKIKENVEVCFSAFAAGGFWGLAILHVLLEAVTACEKNGSGITFKSGAFFNAAYPLTLLGYLVMLLIEAIVSTSISYRELSSSAELDARQRFAIFDAVVASGALTFHSFFEGLIVGLREGNLIWISTISVIGHKWAAAFALSTRLYHHDAPTKIKWITLGVFVLASPVGAIAGMPIGSSPTHTRVVAILNALTAGLLIYLATEITAEVFRCTLHSHSHSQHCDQELQNLEEPHEHHNPHHTESSASKEFHIVACEPLMTTSWKPSPRNVILMLILKFALLISGSGLIFGMMCIHLSDDVEGQDHSRLIQP